jgi:hypothetical protein
VILFLDFDGVLHPEGEDHVLNGGADFCFLPRLEALLREFPQVKIVISSSWREQLLYKTLLKPFSSDIRARILGATPHSGFGLPPPYRKREGEILACLQIREVVDEPWVAHRRCPLAVRSLPEPSGAVRLVHRLRRQGQCRVPRAL